jgi:hypothetical protein
MTPSQNKTLDSLCAQLSSLVDDILKQKSCDLYATVTDSDDGKSVSLTGNAEGLTYFASILLKLVRDREVGAHFHFDADTVLDQCDRNLIIKYERSPMQRL